MVELKPADAALLKLLPPQEPRPDALYVPSQFVLTFTYGEKQYAFHTLTTQLLETELNVAAKQNMEKEALIRGLFLVPEEKDECAYYNSVASLMRLFQRKKGNRGFMILPTLACNARCVYCYEEGMKPVSMTEETADAVVRCIVETHAEEPVKINWFGGEPLLRPDLIDRILEGLRAAGVRYTCGMVSNGSLITPETVAKMKGLWNVTGIQISVDGSEADYIARKQYSAYRNYYHTVMDAIDGMSAAGIRVLVRCNTDENVLPGIPQFLRDLSARVAHKENVQVYFAPLDQVRTGRDALIVWQRIMDLRPLIEAAGFRSYPLFNLNKPFRVYHCMADAGSVVIGPDGRLYPCEHCIPETCFGDVFRGTTDEAKRTAFCRTDTTREKCRKCTFLPTCTNFSTCPVQDTDCSKVKELILIDALKRFIDKKEIEADADDAIC